MRLVCRDNVCLRARLLTVFVVKFLPALLSGVVKLNLKINADGCVFTLTNRRAVRAQKAGNEVTDECEGRARGWLYDRQMHRYIAGKKMCHDRLALFSSSVTSSRTNAAFFFRCCCFGFASPIHSPIGCRSGWGCVCVMLIESAMHPGNAVVHGRQCAAHDRNRAFAGNVRNVDDNIVCIECGWWVIGLGWMVWV